MSFGTNCREGGQAESKPDFIHKFAIAQKVCNETLYWLELLYATNFIIEIEFNSIYSEIMKILTASIKTAKNSLIINH